MPRTSRNTVEFQVEGRTWLATFKHVCDGTKGVRNREGILVQHITICELRPASIRCMVRS
jgi:hypothetical protein